MRFNQLIKFTEVVKNDLSIILKGSDGRYYVSDTEHPDEWHSSHPDFTSAMESLNFTRNFWKEKMDPAIRDSMRTVRVDGTHYYIGEEKAPHVLRGFGGALFLVEFDDGRRVATTNMWCQGNIPKALLSALPNNAKFHDTNEAFAKYHTDDDTDHRMWIDRWTEDKRA